ncbi:hypothetical protein [Stutzerimonas nitrititolerans]|uniref:hypothetical protein n=1 Tax=Stutzerimonas nitrititolerans TaxID=2482751 RepID=UPI00289FAC01|nr:hypothetical protein [Stutzerimonas nitrititolerans]
MGIQVDGNNNRVAGRDYYENKIKPCPRCEIRVIDREKNVCNHCYSEERGMEAKGLLALFGICVWLVTSQLHEWRIERGLPVGIEGLMETMAISAGLVFGAAALIWFFLPIAFEILAEWLKSRRG